MRVHALGMIGGFVLAVTSVGCSGEPPKRLRSEDQVRMMVPPPACVSRLAKPQTGTYVVSLERMEPELWKVVFPAAENGQLPRDAVACTGAPVLSDPALQGGEAASGGWPLRVKDLADTNDRIPIMYGSGGGLKILWFQTHKFPDGTVGGPIATVRVTREYVEVYAVGAYRGPKKARLSIERLGTDVIITATDDGCFKHPVGQGCASRQTVFRPKRGSLVRAGEFDLERVVYRVGTEPTIAGNIEYHLTSTPQYLPGEVRLFEELRVIDPQGRVFRRAEYQRKLQIKPTKLAFEEDRPSLWNAFVQGAEGATAVASADTASSARPPAAATSAQ